MKPVLLSSTFRESLRHPRSAGKGQALTEFLVLAVAMLPVFLLIPLIAKYQDISHQTLIASRYAAFDSMARSDSASTSNSDADLVNAVRLRFFGNPEARVTTNEAISIPKASQNAYWQGPGANALIKNISADVNLSVGFTKTSEHAASLTSASNGWSVIRPDQFDLHSRGIYAANVSVALANIPAGLKLYTPFDQINLTIERTTALLTDPWTAASPEKIEEKIQSHAVIFPTRVLSPIRPMIDIAVKVIDGAGMSRGPQLGRLDFWRDAVPQDRLKSGN